MLLKHLFPTLTLQPLLMTGLSNPLDRLPEARGAKTLAQSVHIEQRLLSPQTRLVQCARPWAIPQLLLFV